MRSIRIRFAAFFFVCAGMSALLYMLEEVPYIQGRLNAEKIFRTYVEAEDPGLLHPDSSESDSGTGAVLKVDFEGLRTVNPDIIGWIYIPGTQVNYPIMQHPTEDDYYLFHTPEKKKNRLGAVYLHHDADSEFKDIHMILFGHNMKSGQMFGELSNYADADFAETYSDVWIFLPGKDLYCIVYTAYVCSVEDLTYTVGYESGQENYEEFICHTLDRSCISTKRKPSNTDQIVTLSTCTDSGNAEKRFVVNCIVAEKTEK